MNYPFPIITNISQILPIVKDRPEFVVAERDGFTVINYNLQTSDTFPPVNVSGGSPRMRAERSLENALLRECRGIAFCNITGRVLARKFHKFFNVNERQETLIENVDFSQPHVIMEKLDGSMITPVGKHDGQLEWHTKMGNTDVAQPVYEFVKNNSQYEEAARDCINYDETPIFEWCSRKQKIVIDHPVDRLVLTAIRNNITGKYYSYAELAEYAKMYNLDCVRVFPSYKPIADFIEHTRGDTSEIEGYIIRFDDGHMVKIKTDLYCAIHKAKEKILHDRNIVEMIIDSKIDDVKAHLTQDERDRLQFFEDVVLACINRVVDNANAVYNTILTVKATKKEFALGHANDLDPKMKSIVFKLMDDGNTDNTYQYVINTIRNNINRNSLYDQNLKSTWFEGAAFNA